MLKLFLREWLRTISSSGVEATFPEDLAMLRETPWLKKFVPLGGRVVGPSERGLPTRGIVPLPIGAKTLQSCPPKLGTIYALTRYGEILQEFAPGGRWIWQQLTDMPALKDVRYVLEVRRRYDVQLLLHKFPPECNQRQYMAAVIRESAKEEERERAEGEALQRHLDEEARRALA